MKRMYWANIILSSTFIVAIGGCIHKPTKPVTPDSSIAHASKPPPQQILLQEARTENENLRAEIGALKILMAKQAGELQSIRGQSQSIHHREQDQGLQLQQVRAELLASQAEKDQLRKHNMELESQVAGMPDTTQLVSDIQALTQSFQHIMTSMKQLSTDITLIKREIHRSSGTGQPLQTKFASPQPSRSFENNRTPDSQGRIVIQSGDSLWKLSQLYHVSVDQLKEWNDLDSNIIMTGLNMRVTSPAEPQPNAPNFPSTTNGPSAFPAIQTPRTEPVQESLPRQESQVEHAQEPKHILSLGNPHLPESP